MEFASGLNRVVNLEAGCAYTTKWQEGSLLGQADTKSGN